MKTLVQKEIRLLLPAFAGALALAILPVWLLPIGTFRTRGVAPRRLTFSGLGPCCWRSPHLDASLA